jgi:hypothetical protein
MGTDANLRCDSETPFVDCRFRSPAGEIIEIGTRCESIYGADRNGRIVKICWVKMKAHRSCCNPVFQGDESLEEKTKTVCGITIKGVQGADEGGWR